MRKRIAGIESIAARFAGGFSVVIGPWLIVVSWRRSFLETALAVQLQSSLLPESAQTGAALSRCVRLASSLKAAVEMEVE